MPAIGTAIGTPFMPGTAGGAAPALDLYHTLITGQSLSVGQSGIPVVSLIQAFQNKMFIGGVRATSGALGSFIPLIATTEEDPASPGAFDGETIANGMADQLARGLVYDSIVSCHGKSGAPYAALKKGTDQYILGMAQAQAAFDLSPDGYKGVVSVVTCHGETDQDFGTPDYAGKLAEWQVDYEADLKAITGQVAGVPLLVYQQCNIDPGAASSAATATALESLKAHINNPGKVVLAGPNYPWIRSDTLHLTAHGYRSMGLIYARVLAVIKAGGTWNPLMPVSVTRIGAVIDVVFNVPTPPIVLDLERVFNPGDCGFSYFDDEDDAVISTVVVQSSNTIRITLDGVPAGTNERLRYGWLRGGAPNGPNGPLGSARGNLRDSATPDNPYGYDCFNWCVLFDKTIPFAI